MSVTPPPAPARSRPRILRYALAATGALGLAAVAIAAYLILTFDVRDHVPRIVELVKEKTGRTLVLHGDAKLSLWPDVGLELGAVSLSERGSDEVFARIANTRIAARLRPLLAGELVADELYLDGADVRITRFHDGRLNIDDLLRGEGGALEFDIARVAIRKSRVEYVDLASGAQHEVDAIELVTGRLAPRVPAAITLSLKARDRSRTYDVAATVEGRLTVDTAQRAYAFDDAKIAVQGHAAQMTDMKLDVKGSVARTPQSDLRATAVSVSGSAAIGGRTMEVRGEAPALVRAGEALKAEAVSLGVRTSGHNDAVEAGVKAPHVEWRDGVLTAPATTLALSHARGGDTIEAVLSGALTANTRSKAADFAGVEAKLFAAGPGWPRGGVQGAATGSAAWDGEGERVAATLAGMFAQSRFKATVSAAGFDAPKYTVDAEVDALDLDRFAPAKPQPASDSGGFDISALSTLPVAGTMRIGRLTRAGIAAKNVQLVFKP